MNTTTLPLRGLRAAVAALPQPAVDVACHAALFGPLLALSVRTYATAAGRRQAHARGMSYPLLVVHIGLGAALVIRYLVALWRAHGTAVAGAATGAGPAAGLPDVLAGMANAACSWALARNRVPGAAGVTRTTFQAMAVVMALAAAAAGVLATTAPPTTTAAAAYRLLVHTHSGFFFVRLLTLFLTRTRMRPNRGDALTIAVFTGMLLAAVQGAGWLGGLLLLASMGGLHVAQLWVSARVTTENATDFFPRLALLVGMVEQGTYAMLESAENAKKLK